MKGKWWNLYEIWIVTGGLAAAVVDIRFEYNGNKALESFIYAYKEDVKFVIFSRMN